MVPKTEKKAVIIDAYTRCQETPLGIIHTVIQCVYGQAALGDETPVASSLKQVQLTISYVKA